MNKVLSKVATAGLMTLVGYEVGQSQDQQEQIIVKIDKDDLKIPEGNANNRDLQVAVLFLLVVLIIVVLVLVLTFCKKNKRRNISTLRA